MRSLFFLLIVSGFLLSCRKDTVQAGEQVEIYTLASFQRTPGKCQVDASTAVLQDTPTIRNADILDYSQGSHEFRLSEAGVEKIKALHDFFAFAITVDRQVIYYGIFKPSFTSSSCDQSITMDLDQSRKKLLLRLGYPGQSQSSTIEDLRNHPRLLATLKKQGKLKG